MLEDIKSCLRPLIIFFDIQCNIIFVRHEKINKSLLYFGPMHFPISLTLNVVMHLNDVLHAVINSPQNSPLNQARLHNKCFDILYHNAFIDMSETL